MTSNEIMALLISGAALGVSVVSLYFSTWHKKISLVGCLVRWESGSIDEDQSATYEFTLSNTGNQELLLREIHVEPACWKENEFVPVLSVENVPQVIGPGAVVLFRVPISNRFISQLAKDNRNIKIRFEVITPKAEVKNALKELTTLLELDPSKDDWKAFKLE